MKIKKGIFKWATPVLIGNSILLHVNGRVYEGVIGNTYINVASSSNSIIFSELGMTTETKREYASRIYGRECARGGWPPYENIVELNNLLEDLHRSYGVQIEIINH